MKRLYYFEGGPWHGQFGRVSIPTLNMKLGNTIGRYVKNAKNANMPTASAGYISPKHVPVATWEPKSLTKEIPK